MHLRPPMVAPASVNANRALNFGIFEEDDDGKAEEADQGQHAEVIYERQQIRLGEKVAVDRALRLS
jgi:hypothetical protein